MRKFWESIYCPNYISGYNPFLLKNMNKAIEKLSVAINNREKIVIYGIPSVDGICAISSLGLVLRYLNADVEYLIGDGREEGKLVNAEEIKDDIDFLGADLLITLGVDLKSYEEVKLCEKLGIKLIVLENIETTDKKEYAYINPRQKECQYRYKDLSLSGLTFKIMQAIAIYYNMKSINKYLDLILLGGQWSTIQMKGENAIILKEGQKFLQNTNNNGLRAMMEKGNIKRIDDESIEEIINLMTPTVNAVGVVSNARIIVELLTTKDRDRAEQISKYLHKNQ